jgi:hypothetical protein
MPITLCPSEYFAPPQYKKTIVIVINRISKPKKEKKYDHRSNRYPNNGGTETHQRGQL